MAEQFMYIQRIQALYPTGIFSRTERTIADYLLKNTESMEEATAASLAEKIGVSAPTIVRFCRKLGFDGFAEMKRRSTLPQYLEEHYASTKVRKGDDCAAVRTKVIEYEKMLMDQVSEVLDDGKLTQIADLLMHAKHVVIMGEGGSGTMCRAAYDMFLKLGLPCRIVEDIIFQTMEISMMGQNDVLFTIVNSGRTVNMITNARYARERGIRTIGIVGESHSPLADHLDVELQTSVYSSDHFSDLSAARLCELTALSVLYSLMAVSSSESQIRKGEEIEASIDLKRIETSLNHL